MKTWRGDIAVITILTAAVLWPLSVALAGQREALSALGYQSAPVALPRPTAEGEFSPYLGGVSLSPDGQLLVYEYRPRPVPMEFVLQIAATSTGELRTASLLARYDISLPAHPDFSPDGGLVAFSGPGGPCVVGVNGEGLRRLGAKGWNYGVASWRPDGKALVVDRSPSDYPEEEVPPHEVVCIDAVNGQVLWSLPMELFWARFSPDGRWLVGVQGGLLVAVELGSGQSTVLLDPTPLGPPGDRQWNVVNAVWAWDSRTVLINVSHRDWELPHGPGTMEIWQASVEGGEAHKIADGGIKCGTVDGRRLLVYWGSAATAEERRQAGEPERQPGDLCILTAEGK
jgi:hypothetical protein